MNDDPNEAGGPADGDLGDVGGAGRANGGTGSGTDVGTDATAAELRRELRALRVPDDPSAADRMIEVATSTESTAPARRGWVAPLGAAASVAAVAIGIAIAAGSRTHHATAPAGGAANRPPSPAVVCPSGTFPASAPAPSDTGTGSGMPGSYGSATAVLTGALSYTPLSSSTAVPIESDSGVPSSAPISTSAAMPEIVSDSNIPSGENGGWWCAVGQTGAPIAVPATSSAAVPGLNSPTAASCSTSSQGSTTEVLCAGPACPQVSYGPPTRRASGSASGPLETAPATSGSQEVSDCGSASVGPLTTAASANPGGAPDSATASAAPVSHG